MDWKLEVVVVPVADLDRAKAFYADMVGFRVDHDTHVNDALRVIQLTPPGSACSIVIGKGLPSGVPGSLKGIQLVVTNIDDARAELLARGVPVGDVQSMGSGDGSQFVFFDDPDGNSWAVQEWNGGTGRPASS